MLYFAEAIRGYLGRKIKRNEKSRHDNDDDNDDDKIYIYIYIYIYVFLSQIECFGYQCKKKT